MQWSHGDSVEVWPASSAAAGDIRPEDWPYEAARLLLSCPREDAMPTVLERLGHWADADRAWMLEYSPDLWLFRNIYEWCRPGVPSHVGDLQDTPVTIIGEMQRHPLAGNPVMIADIN